MPEDGCVHLTVIDSAGTPREMGRAHGEAARPLVQQSLAGWQEAMSRAGHEPSQHVQTLTQASGFRDAIAAHVPDLLEEMAGIADGAGITTDEVFALNCLDEAWWWAEKAGGCSTVAIGTTAGATFAGQTMDLEEWMDGTQIALRTRPTNGPAQVMLSRAGMVGLCGVNEAGAAVLVNTLSQLPVSRAGVPVAFVLRAALAQPTVNDAAATLQRLPHASGQAYTLASADGVIGMECGAGIAAEYLNDAETPRDRWHTNHPLSAAPEGSIEVSSKERMAALDERAPTLEDVAELQGLLADGESGVCMYPNRWPGSWLTFGAVAIEFGATTSVQIAPGPPDRTEWTAVSFLR
jgi:isopenicillin-N N-acyltransferase like protein